MHVTRCNDVAPHDSTKRPERPSLTTALGDRTRTMRGRRGSGIPEASIFSSYTTFCWISLVLNIKRTSSVEGSGTILSHIFCHGGQAETWMRGLLSEPARRQPPLPNSEDVVVQGTLGDVPNLSGLVLVEPCRLLP